MILTPLICDRSSSSPSSKKSAKASAAAIDGGASSRLGGGKFGNGARTGAAQYAFNQVGEDVKRKFLSRCVGQDCNIYQISQTSVGDPTVIRGDDVFDTVQNVNGAVNFFGRIVSLFPHRAAGTVGEIFQSEKISRLGAFRVTNTYQIYDRLVDYDFPFNPSRNYQKTIRVRELIDSKVSDRSYKYVDPLTLK